MKHKLGKHDEAHIRRAIELAPQGQPATRPNPVVGAVLASGSSARTLAEGYHHAYGGPHAERVCLDQVDEVPEDATLYVSLEPCGHAGKQPPCADLLIERGVRRVVYAGRDPSSKTRDKGPDMLRAAGVEVLHAGPSLQMKADELNLGFLSAHIRKRPFVTAKWAMTADGFMQVEGQEWISSEANREAVHIMRAQAGAILIGSGTALTDDPLLTVRGEAARHMLTPPMRVVVDRSLQTLLESKLVTTAADVPTLIYTSQEMAASDYATELASQGVIIEVCNTADDRTTMESVYRSLCIDHGVQDLLVEPGPTLLAVLHDEHLVDRSVIYVSDQVAGQKGISPTTGVEDLFSMITSHSEQEDAQLTTDEGPVDTRHEIRWNEWELLQHNQLAAVK